VRDGEWLAEITRWTRRVSGREDLELSEFTTQAWSTVWRAETADGTVWFKESVSANPAEGAVHQLLSQFAPDQVTPPIGWDDDRGWLLTRDGGRTIFDTYPELRGMTGTVATDLLIPYAKLQQATIGHGYDLAEAGLPDGSPADAADLLASCVQEMTAAPKQDPRHVTNSEAEALMEQAPALRAAGETLMNGPVPLAFDHNDLFPRNVFEPRPRQGYRFFDFAESVWAHPFGSLLMLQWELIHRAGLDVGESGTLDLHDEQISSVFDAYLHQWTSFAAIDDLRQLAALALRIAPLYRTSTWLEVLPKIPTAVEKHGKTPRAWVFDVLRPVRL
jgi:hypothetical protein